VGRAGRGNDALLMRSRAVASIRERARRRVPQHRWEDLAASNGRGAITCSSPTPAVTADCAHPHTCCCTSCRNPIASSRRARTPGVVDRVPLARRPARLRIGRGRCAGRRRAADFEEAQSAATVFAAAASRRGLVATRSPLGTLADAPRIRRRPVDARRAASAARSPPPTSRPTAARLPC
jgi:hypothetical protein